MDDLKLNGKSAAELQSLLNTVRIFSIDILIEFGLDKYTTLTLTKGKITETEGMNLPNTNIKGLNLNETYKYLGISFKQMISNIHQSKKRH